MLTLFPNKVLSVINWLSGWQAQPKKRQFTAPTPESIIRYTEKSLEKQLSCEEAANKIRKSITSSKNVEQLNCNYDLLTSFAAKHSHTVQGKAAEDSLRLKLHNRFKEIYETM